MLTPRQTEILTFIRREVTKRGRMPTIREIATTFRFTSKNGVSEHLRAIERKVSPQVRFKSWHGACRRSAGPTRSRRDTGDSDDALVETLAGFAPARVLRILGLRRATAIEKTSQMISVLQRAFSQTAISDVARRVVCAGAPSCLASTTGSNAIELRELAFL